MPSADHVGVGFAGLLLACAAWAEDAPPGKPLDLLLTREELRAITDRYVWIAPGREENEELDQVTVRAPAELAPMRDASQDVAGGIAAPFWALLHPKDAWRIFLPIPPKADRTTRP